MESTDQTIVVIGKYVDGKVDKEQFGVQDHQITNLDKPNLRVVPKALCAKCSDPYCEGC